MNFSLIFVKELDIQCVYLFSSAWAKFSSLKKQIGNVLNTTIIQTIFFFFSFLFLYWLSFSSFFLSFSEADYPQRCCEIWQSINFPSTENLAFWKILRRWQNRLIRALSIVHQKCHFQSPCCVHFQMAVQKPHSCQCTKVYHEKNKNKGRLDTTVQFCQFTSCPIQHMVKIIYLDYLLGIL